MQSEPRSNSPVTAEQETTTNTTAWDDTHPKNKASDDDSSVDSWSNTPPVSPQREENGSNKAGTEELELQLPSVPHNTVRSNGTSRDSSASPPNPLKGVFHGNVTPPPTVSPLASPTSENQLNDGDGGTVAVGGEQPGFTTVEASEVRSHNSTAASLPSVQVTAVIEGESTKPPAQVVSRQPAVPAVRMPTGKEAQANSAAGDGSSGGGNWGGLSESFTNQVDDALNQKVQEQQQEILRLNREIERLKKAAEEEQKKATQRIRAALTETQAEETKKEARLRQIKEELTQAEIHQNQQLERVDQETEAKVAAAEARVTEAKENAEAQIAQIKGETETVVQALEAKIASLKKQDKEARLVAIAAAKEALEAEANSKAKIEGTHGKKRVVFTEEEVIADKNRINAERKELKAANYTALGVSSVIGSIVSTYSQTLQNMLFGQIFFGKSVLFGFALPMVNLAVASTVFSLVVFSITLTIISAAKSAEGKPLDKSITKALPILPTISAYLVLAKNAVTIQVALFGKILLGGTLLANLGFALIPTAVIGLTLFAASRMPKNFMRSISFGLIMCALSFVVFSIYASPIQIAIFGHAMMIMTPLLSNISFGAIASVISSTATTLMYKFTEQFVIPPMLEPAKTAKSIKAAASNAVAQANDALESIKSTLGCTAK